MTLLKKNNKWHITAYNGPLFDKEDYPRSVEYFNRSTKTVQTGETFIDSFTVKKTGLYTICLSAEDDHTMSTLFIVPRIPGYDFNYMAKADFYNDRCNTTQTLCLRLNKGDKIDFKSYQVLFSTISSALLYYKFQVVLIKDLTKIEKYI